MSLEVQNEDILLQSEGTVQMSSQFQRPREVIMLVSEIIECV